MTISDSPTPRVDTAVLDLDGTLVDSVYAHVLAWRVVFAEVGIDVPGHRIHRAIGMGGDRLVSELAGEAVEAEHGDDLRARHPEVLDRWFDQITATDGAGELLATLEEHGLTVVLASSGAREQTERLLGLVEGADRLSATVTGSEADSSKPSGEIIDVALASVDATTSVVVGDAVWDVEAARDAGVPCIGLLTGGISEAELLAAGARAVHAGPRALAEHLRRTGSLLP